MGVFAILFLFLFKCKFPLKVNPSTTYFTFTKNNLSYNFQNVIFTT